MSSNFENERATSHLSGGSMAYVDSLYEDFIRDPQSIPDEWRDFFSALPEVEHQHQEVSHQAIRQYFLDNANKKTGHIAGPDLKQTEVAHLINAYRTYGHLEADLDPLNMTERASAAPLQLSYHNLSDADMGTTFYAGESFSPNRMPLKQIQQILKDTYCNKMGIEYMHIANTEERNWLQEQLELVHGEYDISKEKKRAVLRELIATEGLEKYLGTRYVGQKRFSVEGGDALIPLVKEAIHRCGSQHVKDLVIGMAHRGRLNVLVNVLGKEPDKLFQEFEGNVNHDRTGDVKYHMGFSSDIKTDSGNIVHVALAFNPSHLEIIDPVVEGSVRSRLRRRGDLDKKDSVVPFLIHGDAAFAGQGVVAETFNFSQSRGYCTGGTVHVVVNNQVGFTTSNPLDSRSTLYCTDVAKMVQAPVIHVNGDDPDAVIFATRVAIDFRMKFKRDVVIDLVCYRRHGHNEADEPSVTQPLMYQKVKSTPTVKELYSEKLIKQNITTQTEVDKMVEEYRDRLDKGQQVVETVSGDYEGKMAVDWTPYLDAKWTDEANTTIDEKTIKQLSAAINHFPEDFTAHRAVKKLYQDRQQMAAGEEPLNWGFAETMAYASLVHEGFGVRLSGQDSGRGTFAHRHAVLHDQKTGKTLTPLEQVSENPLKSFVVIDSVLSEEAVLAFEYGYSTSEPNTLVIWEAQFGDFANGAQVVIDQFISSGEQKWGRLSGLVMLLPHGYEGQGPEHSSARLERFMQLCAQQNIQVCTPTTPAQIFHLLRRQVIRNYRKPLIIMSPKSLLRHKQAVSTLNDLSNGKFWNVIPEVNESLDAKKINKIILCCGKVYYDLLQKRDEASITDVAIIRIEQLYPFPKQALIDEMAKYSHAEKVVWCQEEPKNQGVWFSSQHNIKDCLHENQKLYYAGRAFAASPAVGSPKLHAEQQQALINEALLEI